MKMDLTDNQWAILEPIVEPRDGCGDKLPCDSRSLLNGVLWVLRTGIPWQGLPERYPSYQVCRRFFREWKKDGRIELILQILVQDLLERGNLNLSQENIDQYSAGPAKSRALYLIRQSAAKGSESWQLETAMVFLSPCTWPTLLREKAFRRDAPVFAVGTSTALKPWGETRRHNSSQVLKKAKEAGRSAVPEIGKSVVFPKLEAVWPESRTNRGRL
jgi:transposase